VLPPFVGVGVNVTASPTQIEVPEAVMLTAGLTVGETEIVNELELAVVGLAQLELEVMIQVTTSPLFSVELVNVTPVPALAPFTCHW
jgi:hypothetical protein